MNEETKPKAQFELPCEFTIRIQEIYGMKPSGESDEDGIAIMIPDIESTRFRAVITGHSLGSADHNLYHIAVESPQFNATGETKHEAWRCLQNCLVHTIASATTAPDQRPHYKLEETEEGIKYIATP